jgi:hypothetical protein
MGLELMAIQLQGNAGVVADVDGAGFRALRTTQRPLDIGSLGGYRLAMQSGVMAAGLAANSEVFQFRWTDATRLCVLHKVVFDGMGSIIGFAAGVAQFKCTIARAFSASGTGGTAATLTGDNQAVRTSHPATLLTEARIASTAALGAGTKTLDAQDVGAVLGGLPATAGAGLPEGDLIRTIGMAEHPIVLAQNEGFVVRATVPATGTWTFGITVGWSEVTAY